MAFVHRCKVTTAVKTVCDDPAIQVIQTRYGHDLAGYTPKRVYWDLLRQEADVQWLWEKSEFSVPLKRSILGLYLLPVEIDKKTYWFVMDTGAQISGISPSLLAEHPLQPLPGNLSIRSVGGREKAMTGYLMDHLKFGSLAIEKLPMLLLDTPLLPSFLAKWETNRFAGILGWDILSQIDFELDDIQKEFKVIKNHYRFTYPNMVRAMFPIFLTKDAHGNWLVMGFDSGARYSWVNPKMMQKYAYSLSKETEMFGYGVHGMETMKTQILPELDLYLDRAKLALRNIHTAETEVFHHVELDGILGNEIFRNRRMRILNHQSTVLMV